MESVTIDKRKEGRQKERKKKAVEIAVVARRFPEAALILAIPYFSSYGRCIRSIGGQLWSRIDTWCNYTISLAFFRSAIAMKGIHSSREPRASCDRPACSEPRSPCVTAFGHKVSRALPPSPPPPPRRFINFPSVSREKKKHQGSG